MALKVIQNAAIGKVLAVASGKGGVGKSTLTALLALSLKKRGASVGILDADLYGPSMRALLPEESLPTQNTEEILPAVSNGIKMLTLAFFQNEAFVRAPIANQLLKLFLKKTVWGNLDWLLIDFPPGTGDIAITLSQESQLAGALLVSTPQKLACLDVAKALVLFQKMQVPIFGVVENMSDGQHKIFGKGHVEQLALDFGVPFLGKIDLDAKIAEHADQGSLNTLEIPALDKIAAQLHEKHSGLLEEYFVSMDKKTLRLEKKGEKVRAIEAFLLQKNCPCAGCQNKRVVKEDVEIIAVERVGQYGLRFTFSSGCSFGIYDFEFLLGLAV